MASSRWVHCVHCRSHARRLPGCSPAGSDDIADPSREVAAEKFCAGPPRPCAPDSRCERRSVAPCAVELAPPCRTVVSCRGALSVIAEADVASGRDPC